MSLVPFKASVNRKMVSLDKMFQDCLPSLGIHEILAPHGLRQEFRRPYIKCCRRMLIAGHGEGAIIIFSPQTREKLMVLAESSRQKFFADLILQKVAFLIFAQTEFLPVVLKKLIEHHEIPMANSALHEHHLESRLKALIHEKIQQRVTVHGVTLEIEGKGILITGESGIGKTTAAIEVMDEGCAWIADDLAVIQKDQRGRLIISGHGKIKNFLHTEQTGIIAVDHILNTSQIKNRSQLHAVIEVIRTDDDDTSCRLIEKQILSTTAPCLRITIPRAGYFNKNLLKQAIQHLKEVG